MTELVGQNNFFVVELLPPEILIVVAGANSHILVESMGTY